MNFHQEAKDFLSRIEEHGVADKVLNQLMEQKLEILLEMAFVNGEKKGSQDAVDNFKQILMETKP